MRDLVRCKSYRLRKILDDFLFRMFPNVWIPLYNSVSFSHMPYKQCVENRKWQNQVRIGHFDQFQPLLLIYLFI